MCTCTLHPMRFCCCHTYIIERFWSIHDFSRAYICCFHICMFRFCLCIYVILCCTIVKLNNSDSTIILVLVSVLGSTNLSAYYMLYSLFFGISLKSLFANQFLIHTCFPFCLSKVRCTNTVIAILDIFLYHYWSNWFGLNWSINDHSTILVDCWWSLFNYV